MWNGITPRLSDAQTNAPNSGKQRRNVVYQFHTALEAQTNTNTKQTLQTSDTNKLKTLRSEHCESEKRCYASALTRATSQYKRTLWNWETALRLGFNLYNFTRWKLETVLCFGFHSHSWANITFLPLCFWRICGKKSTVIENVRRVVYFSLSSQTISSIQFQIWPNCKLQWKKAIRTAGSNAELAIVISCWWA